MSADVTNPTQEMTWSSRGEATVLERPANSKRPVPAPLNMAELETVFKPIEKHRAASSAEVEERRSSFNKVATQQKQEAERRAAAITAERESA